MLDSAPIIELSLTNSVQPVSKSPIILRDLTKKSQCLVGRTTLPTLPTMMNNDGVRDRPWACPHKSKVCGLLLRGGVILDCFKVMRSPIEGLGLFFFPDLLKPGEKPSVGFGGLTLCFACTSYFYYNLDENGRPKLEARFVFCCLFTLCVKYFHSHYIIPT
jgi:hypothetical protein